MPRTILIVEDNAKNMKLVRDLLQHQGHRTLEAETGEAGLAMALSERPDLVLMDIQLPDIDGATVLARIRADTSLDAMPVLAVSASVMPDEQQRIVRSGFDGFIAKPISIRPFLAAVERALTEGRPR
jgi:two-component system, cell cycle response regulator DivK